MTFSDFQTTRAALLAARPELRDCAETNLYRALAWLKPDAPLASAETSGLTVHRCHLASQWVEFFGLPGAWARRAFVTAGVRDALNTMFAHLSGKPGLLWLPEDNYPVYHELAAARGLPTETFPTLPAVRWPDDAGPAAAVGAVDSFEGGWEWLLVTHPLKPRGRALDDREIRVLRQWLAVKPTRRVVLDMVYLLETRLDAATLQLLETGQVIVLHSLTKGWLHPRCFGVALMPESDQEEWMPVFRAKPPSQTALATARWLMRDEQGTLPRQVSEALRAAQCRLRGELGPLAEGCLESDPDSYFLLVERRWEELLKGGVLGLPGSVFGAPDDRFTVLSSLSFAEAKAKP